MNKRKQSTLLEFCNKKKNNSSNSTVISADADDAVVISEVIPASTTIYNKVTTSNIEVENDISSLVISNDIGHYINSSRVIEDTVKIKLLENKWKPPPSFKYPFSIHNKQGKEEKRFLRYNHFEQFPWLVYSESLSGCFCLYCTLFLVQNTGGKQNTEQLKKLVTVPLKKYAKLLGKHGDLETHSNNEYHKNAILRSEDFVRTHLCPDKRVDNLLNTERYRQVTENRNRLKPIVESIIFLGRQNIAFRGHRDQGNLIDKHNLNEIKISSSVVNEGNFRELLRFRVGSGDDCLKNHLLTAHSKATYISHTIQYQLIKCCKEEILTIILKDVKKSQYYSIIFDETTDIAHISQMSLILRYIDEKNQVFERFVGFLNCHDKSYDNANVDEELQVNEPKLTGEKLGDIVISILKSMSLDLENCVGIGTDGCSVMISQLRDAVQQVQKHCINAVHSPCSNHALNLSISKSSDVQLVRNTMGIIKEIILFFKLSSKRNFLLKNNLKG